MALPDPVTIAARAPTPALVFATVKMEGMGSERRDAAGAFTAVISHTKNKGGDRHYLKITEVKDASNPYTGGISKQSASVSLSVSVPPFGWTEAQAIALITVLTDFLADSEVTPARFLQFQS